MTNADQIQLPGSNELIERLVSLSSEVDAISRYLQAFETRSFVHPDGRTDDLGTEALPPERAALLTHLCHECKTPLSIEVGFGMGASAVVILGVRRHLGKKFEHQVFDPFGLPDGRGSVVESYLEQEFKEDYCRVRKPSEVGLAQLLDERGRGAAGLIFIDGGHLFENVMIDFVLADQLCCEGGYIVLDDSLFPAIETVVNYVISNRPDYAVIHQVVPNATLLKKIAADDRHWASFEPFMVPHRRNWEMPPVPEPQIKAVAAPKRSSWLKPFGRAAG